MAALGLLAVAEQDVRGYNLRSRCDLVCEGRAPLELVRPDGAVQEVEFTRDWALTLYSDSIEVARNVGFDFPLEPIRLFPQPKLVEIVRQSQELALQGQGGEAEE